MIGMTVVAVFIAVTTTDANHVVTGEDGKVMLSSMHTTKHRSLKAVAITSET